MSTEKQQQQQQPKRRVLNKMHAPDDITDFSHIVRKQRRRSASR